MDTKRQPPLDTFHFKTLAEMLGIPPKPAWLIRDYLEADTLAVLFGASGVMKSFVALDMAFCVAAGIPWHSIPTYNTGPCFYIAGEGLRGLSKRLKALSLRHSSTDDAVPLFISSGPIHLLETIAVKTLEAEIFKLMHRHGQPRLVVIDTLNRCFGPGDENKAEDMTAFVVALDSIRKKFGCTVMVIHHSGNKKQERSRGSSALRAAIDFEYCLKENGNKRMLICTKCKDHDEPGSLSFVPETVNTGWTDPETFEEISSCVLRRIGEEDRCKVRLAGANLVALQALTAACQGDGQTSVKSWRAKAYEMKISPKGTETASQQAFNRALKWLIGNGYVHEDKEQKVFWPSRRDDQAHDNSQPKRTCELNSDDVQTCQAQHDRQTRHHP